MPEKLRPLSGKEVIRIFQNFGFEFDRQKGSHVHLKRVVNKQKQKIVVPVHGKKSIKPGTLKSIYKKGCEYIPEEDLKSHFYTD